MPNREIAVIGNGEDQLVLAYKAGANDVTDSLEMP